MSYMDRTYGSDDAIHSLTSRISTDHSQRELLGWEGARRLAQFALAIGARVLPDRHSEVEVWPDDETGELLFTLSYTFYVRIANEQGGYIPYPTAQRMSKRHRTAFGVAEDDVAAFAGGIRHSDLEPFKSLPFEPDLDKMTFYGHAVVTAEEMEHKKPPTGRTWQWVAEKRAAVDLIRKMFGIPMTSDADDPETAVYKPPKSEKNGKVERTLDELNQELFG
jgi:hypothetical protein